MFTCVYLFILPFWQGEISTQAKTNLPCGLPNCILKTYHIIHYKFKLIFLHIWRRFFNPNNSWLVCNVNLDRFLWGAKEIYYTWKSIHRDGLNCLANSMIEKSVRGNLMNKHTFNMFLVYLTIIFVSLAQTKVGVFILFLIEMTFFS